MSNDEDRILDEGTGMVALTHEEIRKTAMSAVIHNLFAARSVILPFGAVLLAVIVFVDPTPLKLSALALTVIFLIGVSISDRLRMRSKLQLKQLDLLVIVLLQTGVIFLTGGIESPVLPAYVIAGFAAGVALGRGPARVIVLGINIALWSMTLGALVGLIPRTLPSFLGLEHGFATDARYALTKAGVVTVITILSTRLGSRVNDTILKTISSAIEARQRALESLQDRNRELVHLSGAIAHELKNPLASIQGLVQLLERGGANAERRFEVLNQEIARMKTTLDAFLNLSRPLGELSIEQVASDALLDELTALHEGMAQAKSITVAKSAATIPAIACDPRKMKQALTNLLQNAIEATPQGGRVSWIAEKNEQTLSIGVEDSGPGITPELIVKVANVGVTTKRGGNGIGLAVARSIAEQHGGKLVLANLESGGLRATLELPR